ncbi:hypothetical protein AA650_16635 [Anabaena sp. WA102]|uniref:beta strand repeat-containing protein n=1 Tax=Anabaena sp. WA102 TaxID=1647413 RepID=UPI0006AC4B15|nr:hypothetical protein [Anabaena sp. WA102]ALB41862.1 hypothetical protein AA650_16635 [Anabaena sp. WA102]
MQSTRKSSTRRKSQLFRSLIATAFIANGFFPFVAPALADGTKAGQVISNTATATYEDPNKPGTTINATSNTVTVTVAEVAGITVTNTGVPTDNTPADEIKVGDILTYTFTIKNVGNDPTTFRIPNLATTTGPGVVDGNLKYSTDGTSYTEIISSQVITDSISVGGTILVQVPVKVQAGANTGDIITVQLGDTPGNAQNVLRVNNGGDVYTVDNTAPLPANEIDGAPINGTREASAKQQSVIGSLTKNLALATLLKTRTDYSKGSPLDTLDDITDDKITYGLSLRVESNDVTGLGITPNPLAGYSMTVIGLNNDAPGNYILVSDVIPAGTVLAEAPTAPAGWTAVYSTLAANTVKPTDAAVAWNKTAPGDITTVKRVGFVKDTTTTSSIPVGTTVSGFSIKLGVATGATSPLRISNIAQVVGQTPGGLPVYDESGDQNPSNYNGVLGNMKPGVASTDGILPTDVAAVIGGISDGVADDPATQGVDASNDNTGVGDGGEDNVFVITAITAASVLNGPLNAPSAIGPDGTTATDFTNKSSFIPAGTSPGSKIDPQAVAFSNTVQNNGTTAGNVTLEPTVPANKLDLPTGTTVTITYNGLSAVYTYSQTGSGSFATTAATPVTIPNVTPGASVGYGVEVNLPAGTKLSTDTLTDYTDDTEWGYPVPITATLGSATNVTIDRVYTGFLQLVKFSRILQGTSDQAVGTGQDNFESTPKYANAGVEIDPNSTVNDVPRTPLPGNIIEYQIRYKNISDLQAGVGNVTLKAGNIVITEDGALSAAANDGKNNWAIDNDSDSIIDTSNVTNPQASDSNSGTIQFFPSVNQSGTTAATDVTKYVNTVNQIINPQGSGRFTFQRKVN